MYCRFRPTRVSCHSQYDVEVLNYLAAMTAFIGVTSRIFQHSQLANDFLPYILQPRQLLRYYGIYLFQPGVRISNTHPRSLPHFSI